MDWLAGAAGFEPLHLRIELAKTLSSGRECASRVKLSCRLLAKKKSQAMTKQSDLIPKCRGSNPSTTRGHMLAHAGGPGPSRSEIERKIGRMARPWRRTGALRAAGRSWRSPFKPTRSRKLGYKLLKFGLRPSATSTSAHVTLRPKCECKFCDVVSVRSVYDDKEVVLAGREIDLLDFNSHFLGQLLRGFSSLRSVLD